MECLVNAREMKECDKNTIEYYGIPSAVLMERAALAIFHEIQSRFDPDCGKILIVCGAGNNGGDGFATARILHLAGYEAEYMFPMEETKMTPETKAQYQIIKKYIVPECRNFVQNRYAVIVDALFGIGLSRKVEGELGTLLDHLNRSQAFKIAADIASGISADTGQLLGTAFRADLTVTFGFAKIGQLLYPGAAFTGELVVADIGIDKYGFLGNESSGCYLKNDSAKQLLPVRKAYSNKGTYGKTLVIAGSLDMAGAAYFAAKAAYYSGCGLVRILTAKENRDILLTRLGEAVLKTYDAQAEHLTGMMDLLDESMNWADAVLIGPGIGISPAAKMLVAKVLQYTEKKIVFDADALNILARNMVLLKENSGCRVVTPHLGEMGRLTGRSVGEIQADLIGTAKNFAKEYQTVCVLKDARTVIGLSDGRFFVNTTGNCGMATGGSGDVLAGFLTGFLAQGLSLDDAAMLAVYLHGAAGDLAAQEIGVRGMLASDILEKLPEVIR